MPELMKVFNVEGMSCSHCERAIKNALAEFEGVLNTEVDLTGKTVTVKFDNSLVTEKQLSEAIEETGYDVV